MIKNNKFYWNKNGWIFLKSMKFSKKEFSIDEKISSNNTSLKIKSNYDDFIIYFEFELIQNKWYLSYYSSEWY